MVNHSRVQSGRALPASRCADSDDVDDDDDGRPDDGWTLAGCLSVPCPLPLFVFPPPQARLIKSSTCNSYLFLRLLTRSTSKDALLPTSVSGRCGWMGGGGGAGDGEGGGKWPHTVGESGWGD